MKAKQMLNASGLTRQFGYGRILGATSAVAGAYMLYSKMNPESKMAYAHNQAINYVYGWGSSSKGQVGLGANAISVPVPTQIVDLEDYEIIQLAAKYDKSCAVTKDGIALTWGNAKNGSMVTLDGTTFTENQVLPTEFPLNSIVYSALGKDHMGVVTDKGLVLTLGSPDHGKLGHDPKELTEEEKAEEKARYKKAGYKPKNVQQEGAIAYVFGDLRGVQAKQVACGFQHTVALSKDGELYSWGKGKTGALGHGNTDDVTVPQKIEELSGIVKVECGNDYTLVLDD